MKDTLIEIKNNLQGNNSRVDEAQGQINDMEHKEAKNNHSEQQEEKRITPAPRQKNEDSISSLLNNFKQTNICIIGVLEEEKEQEIGSLFEKIMKEKVPNLVKEQTCKSRKHRESQPRWIQRRPI